MDGGRVILESFRNSAKLAIVIVRLRSMGVSDTSRVRVATFVPSTEEVSLSVNPMVTATK